MLELIHKLPGNSSAEKLVWMAFCATCLQLTFRVPYVALVPGYNTNLFAGVLCAVTFLLCIMAMGRNLQYSRAEVAISLALACLTVLNTIMSSDPFRSSLRGFTLLATGLGGFWCSRMLLHDEAARGFFRKLCLLLLSGAIMAGLVGYFLEKYPASALDLHKHPFNGMILLFTFAPLALLWERRRLRTVGAAALLILSYLVIALSFDPMVWFPPILFFITLLLMPFRRKARLVAVASLVAVFAGYFHYRHVPPRFGEPDDLSTYIRAENYFFSFHLAVRNPWLGIGLCAPREPHLEGYEVKYPYVTKERFRSHLPENRTSENQFLTFMSDMGFPFLVLYGGVLAFLVVRLGYAVRRGGSCRGVPPVALFVPIAGELLHFQFYDGLLHPQICWFFHLLLGMIPSPEENPPHEAPQSAAG